MKDVPSPGLHAILLCIACAAALAGEPSPEPRPSALERHLAEAVRLRKEAQKEVATQIHPILWRCCVSRDDYGLAIVMLKMRLAEEAFVKARIQGDRQAIARAGLNVALVRREWVKRRMDLLVNLRLIAGKKAVSDEEMRTAEKDYELACIAAGVPPPSAPGQGRR